MSEEEAGFCPDCRCSASPGASVPEVLHFAILPFCDTQGVVAEAHKKALVLQDGQVIDRRTDGQTERQRCTGRWTNRQTHKLGGEECLKPKPWSELGQGLGWKDR
jgi:hypothetical protein